MKIAKPLSTTLSTTLSATLLIACCALAQAQTSPAAADAATKQPVASTAAREGSLQVEAEIADAGQKSNLKARIAAPGSIGFSEGGRHYRISVVSIDGNSYRVDYHAAPQQGVGGEKQLALGTTDGSLIAEIGKKAQVEISNGFKLSLVLSR